MLAENGPTFDRFEVGQIVIRLQAFCDCCPRAGRCAPFRTSCAVGRARTCLTDYLATARRIVQEFDFANHGSTPAPPCDRRDELEATFAIIPGLCNRCMFHAELCFLNVVHALIEGALAVADRKPPATRPIDRGTVPR